MTTEQTLGEEVADYVNAGFPGLWVHSYEHEEAVIEIARAVISDQIPIFFIWDCVKGLERFRGFQNGVFHWDPVPDTAAPNAAIDFLGGEKPPNQNPQKDTDFAACVVIMKNLHPFLGKGPMNQILMNYLVRAKRVIFHRLVVLSVESQIPKDLEKEFHPITHRLPNADQIRRNLREIAVQDSDLPEDPEEVEAIVEAASGLTHLEAENAFSLCLGRDGQVTAPPVFAVKAKTLEKGDLGLELLKGDETFDDIGGLGNLKEFCTDMLENRSDDPKLAPKGIILAGVPGTGKSLFAKALGNTVHPQRPTIRWDIGQTMSKWVGDSQHKMLRCLNTIDAMAPCNLFADEFEKQVSTGMGSDTTSGGVQTQMLGQWLTWHQEHTSDVFVILTMNNIMAIARNMPEFLARFDEVFFLDFPAKPQKEEIWKIHLTTFGHIEGPEQFDPAMLPNDTDWTGRDIWKCCRQAAQRNKPLSEIRIGTLAQQVSETIGELRDFANGRWMSVEYPDYYDVNEHAKKVGTKTVTHGRDIVKGGKKRRRTEEDAVA